MLDGFENTFLLGRSVTVRFDVLLGVLSEDVRQLNCRSGHQLLSREVSFEFFFVFLEQRLFFEQRFFFGVGLSLSKSSGLVVAQMFSFDTWV